MSTYLADMYSPFIEVQGRIDAVRENLVALQKEFDRVTAPDFDPLNMPEIAGFSRHSGTPDQAFDILYNVAPQAEVDYQMKMVGYCLRQMKLANELMQLQNQYKPSLSGNKRAALERTIEEDNGKFNDLVLNAGELRQEREKPGLPYPLDELSYYETFIQLVRDNDDAEKGKISWQYQYTFTPEDTLTHLFQARADSLMLALGATESLDERIAGSLADYALIRMVQDEAILPDTPYLEMLAEAKKDFCQRMLPHAREAVDQVEHFCGELQQMGPNNFGYREFTVEAYVPLTIRTLPQFTP